MTTTRNFMGTKVFIALRPDIFGRPDEHVTVEYIGHFPEWNSLLTKIQDWETKLGLERDPNVKDYAPDPLRVKVNGYANWCAKDEYHHVALVGFPSNLDLSFSKNWHITLESSPEPLESFMFDKHEDAFRYDDVTELWLGYKDVDNNKKWVTVRNAKHLVKQLGTTNGELTSLR